MPVTATPVFAQAVKTAQAVATAAKTDHATAAGAVLLVTAGVNGALVKSLHAIPRATVTATGCQAYISKDAGTTLSLIDSVLMAAHTVAATTAIPKTIFTAVSEDTPLRLEPGDGLYVAIAVALGTGIVFHAGFEDF